MLQSLYIISSYSKLITFITLFLTTILYGRLRTYEIFMSQPLDIILSYSRTTTFVTLFPYTTLFRSQVFTGVVSWVIISLCSLYSTFYIDMII